MDERRAMDILSGRRRGLAPTLLRTALLAASGPYALVMRLRRALYRLGLLPRRRAAAPVLCVGNLTTGGTGKTPMVAWIVSRLREMGYRPAVLTRGYKSVAGVSDEAELLRRTTGAKVFVDADRAAAAKAAVADGADVLVMDDGFQHLRLRRDLDIVLIDATNPFGYGHCLPRGLLREPPAALRDAACVVVTRSDAVPGDELAALRARLRALAPRASLHTAAHRPVAFLDVTGAARPLDALAGRKVCALAGIGNPEPFFRMLDNLHVRLVDRRAVGDHAEYAGPLLETLRDGLAGCEAELVVTTEKDYVRLAAVPLPRPVWRLAVEIDLLDGRDELLSAVRRCLQ